jgi:hypothetical protein
MGFWADVMKFCGSGDELRWKSIRSVLLAPPPSHGLANHIATKLTSFTTFPHNCTGHSAT